MLINIFLILLVVINAFIALYAYRKGVQDIQKIITSQEIKTNIELPKMPPKPHKETKEEKAVKQKRSAIDNYQGW